MSLSGKFVLRLDPALHAQLVEESRRRGCSLNRLCVDRIRSGSEEPNRVVTYLQAEYGDHLLGVLRFGSQVSGRATAASDEDYLIVLDSHSELTRELYRRFENSIADEKISPQFVKAPTDLDHVGGLWLEVALNSEIVFDREHRMKKLKTAILERIASGKYQRKMSHGHPYWVKGESS